MRRLTLSIFVLCLNYAYASNPTYLSKVEGFIWESAVSPHTFSFSPGTLKQCERDEIHDVVEYDCSTASATLKTAGVSYNFDRVLVRFRYSTYDKKHVRDYLFIGENTLSLGKHQFDSRVFLRFIVPEKQPKKVTGYIKLGSSTIQTPLTASVEYK